MPKIPPQLPKEVNEAFAVNMLRVAELLTLYDSLTEVGAKGLKKKGRKEVTVSDILRSAVVLLHASLEDFLRRVCAVAYPYASSSHLDAVPLVGQSGRAEKFLLGSLEKHRGKTVLQLIQESVSASLERSNYNSVPEVLETLKACGVPERKVERYLAGIGRMMTRRHHIVHRADRSRKTGMGHHKAESIGRATVTSWTFAVIDFAIAVSGHFGGGPTIGEQMGRVFHRRVVKRRAARRPTRSAPAKPTIVVDGRV